MMVRDPLARARASECVERRSEVVVRYESRGELEFLPETLACIDEFTRRGGVLGVLCGFHEGTGSENVLDVRVVSDDGIKHHHACPRR